MFTSVAHLLTSAACIRNLENRRESPNLQTQVVNLREAHSYLMTSATSTSLPVQLTRLQLAGKNQSALPALRPQWLRMDGWMDEKFTFSIMYDVNSKLDWLAQRGTEHREFLCHSCSLSRLDVLLNLTSFISYAASVLFKKLLHSLHWRLFSEEAQQLRRFVTWSRRIETQDHLERNETHEVTKTLSCSAAIQSFITLNSSDKNAF